MSKIPVLNTIVPAGDFPVAYAKDIAFNCKENVAEALERIDTGNVIEVTYDELVNLRDNGGLSVGEMYRITDYTFTTVNSTTLGTMRSANHQFDIIVTAIAKNKLSEVANAAVHEGDTYFKNNKLEAWELRYSLDNDRARFDWAADGGKGVIYYMKDEYSNECTYDFKNCLFRRWKCTSVNEEEISLLVGKYCSYGSVSGSHLHVDADDYIDCYTFTDVNNGIVKDLTMTQSQVCRDNKNCLNSTNTEYIRLPNNVWTNGLVPENVTPDWDGCRQIEIMRGFQNTMGYWCFVSAQYGFDYNIINYCRHMDFGNTTRNNIIANDGTEDNIFGFNITSPQGLYQHIIGNEKITGAHFTSEIFLSEFEKTVHNGINGHSEGVTTIAVGTGSHSEGQYTRAEGSMSHAEGSKSKSSGKFSHAEGQLTISEGSMSHAEGNKSESTGGVSHAEGQETLASGNMSHSEGESSVASGRCSHAGGTGTVADAFNVTALGMYNKPSTTPTTDKTRGEYAFVIGNGTDDEHRSNALAVKWDGTLVLGGVSITPAQLQALLNKL